MSDNEDTAHYGLDEVDEQIIYYLMSDARNNTAPKIADDIGVAPGTVRNRIEQLEAADILCGYHANVDFERTDHRLASLFLCNVSFPDRAQLARAAYEIPGIISIRILMDGRRNFQVLAVGETTADLRRIGTTLSEIGVDIDEEMLLEEEIRKPYDKFAPGDEFEPQSVTKLNPHTAEEFVQLTVVTGAPIAGMTIKSAIENEVIEDEPLIVSITRDESLITPHGDTVIEPGDEVRIFSTGPLSDETMQAFTRGS